MKILIIRPYPTVMNVKNYNAQEVGMAKAFMKLGHKCDIVYYNGNNEPHIDVIKTRYGDLKIIWPKSYCILGNGIIKGIRKLSNDYDSILLAEYDQLLCWYFYTFSKNKKYKVFIYHGQYDTNISKKHIIKQKFFDLFLLHKFNTKNVMVFAKSDLAKKSLVNKGFKNVFVTGVGIDTTRFIENRNTDLEFVENLKKQKGKSKYLLYIGVLEPRRNIIFLCDVFKKILDKNKDVKLVMIGKGKKEYVETCFDYMKSKGISDRIIYKDSMSQSDLSEIYAICDIFCLPTKYEIFGMVLLESMYFKLPIVTSLNGGSSTLIKNDKFGLVIKSFNENVWADEICSLLDDNKRLEEIAKNAYKLVNERFNWDNIIVNYLSKM